MAGNEIYIGKIMSSMIEAMEGVVENTQWLKNLYNSNGLRATKSFSSSDASLKGAASSTGGFTAGALTLATMTYGGSGVQLATTSPSSACSGSASKVIVLPAGADKLKYTVSSSNGGTSGVVSVAVDGVALTVGTDLILQLTELQKSRGYVTVTISVSKAAGSGTSTVSLNSLKVLNSTGNMLACFMLPASNYTADAALTIAAGQTEALLILNKLSGVTASKLDLFNMTAVQNNGDIRIGFADSVSLVGMFGIIDSDWIGDFNSLSFDIYIYISRPTTADLSPTVSAIAIRYLQ